jgi:hypothetical protein
VCSKNCYKDYFSLVFHKKKLEKNCKLINNKF